MKKLLYSILALAGVVATSCTQEHIDVTYDPAKVDAPVINSVTGEDLSLGVDVTINYSEVNYNQPISDPVYSLYVAKSGADMADKVKLSTVDFSKATEGENGSKNLAIPAKTLNNLLVKTFEAEFDKAFKVDFQIEAAVKNEKGTAVAGTESYSNIVSATFIPFEAKEAQPDKDEFAYIWVIGNYCGWDHSKTQFLYDYANDGNTYSGVIDFAGKAADGFKLTGVAGWDDSCNWGCDENNMPTEQEPASIQLISSGGSKDIKAYAKRYYHFSFDKSTLVLTKNDGFDSVGIIGVGGDWDNDKVQMEFNPLYCRFYADVTFAEGDQFKVRADGAWNLNWGVDAVVNGDNYTVSAAGNYRVYLSLNKGTLEINADMYGKDEPGAGAVVTPDPEPTETTYGLIGQFNGWGEPDVDLVARGDGWYVVKDVVIPAADENKFLIRLNDAWTNKFGFAEDNTFVTIDGKNTLTAEGADMWIVEGTFDFYFNPTTAELYVMTAGAADPTIPADAKAVKIYGDVTATGWTNCNAWIWEDGGANYTGGTWPGQALETEQVGDKTYYVFNADVSMYGKTVGVIFNNGSEQTVDLKGVVLTDDVIITLTEKGDDGKWNATINGQEPVTPEPPAEVTYGLIGQFNGWGEPDVDLVARGDGWYVTEALTIDGEFLIRLNDKWDEKFGFEAAGTFAKVGENVLKYGGENMNIAAGTYDFYFNPTNAKMYVANAGDEDPTAGIADAWGLMGTFVDNNWSSDVWLNAEGNYLVAKGIAFAQATAEFKVRKNGSWEDPDCFGTVDGGTYNVGDAIQIGATADGSGNNVKVNVDTTKAYDVYFDLANLKVCVVEAGATPAI